MVSAGRPEYASKERIGKTLVFPNGKNRIAHIGLVDDFGVMCYMLDSGNVEHFFFTDYNDLLAESDAKLKEAEHAESSALMQRDAAEHETDRLLLLMERSIDAMLDMYEMCKFPKGEKSRMCHIISNIRHGYKEVKTRVEANNA